MSKHLHLVSSFHPENYPFVVDVDLTYTPEIYGPSDNFDSYFVDNIKSTHEMRARHALSLAGITDFHLMHRAENESLHIYLTSEQDMTDVLIGLSDDKELVHAVENDTPVSKKALKSVCKELKQMWNDAGLKGRFDITPTHEKNGFEVRTEDKAAYFQVQRDLRSILS